jgi:hypothetical protein
MLNWVEFTHPLQTFLWSKVNQIKSWQNQIGYLIEPLLSRQMDSNTPGVLRLKLCVWRDCNRVNLNLAFLDSSRVHLLMVNILSISKLIYIITMTPSLKSLINMVIIKIRTPQMYSLSLPPRNLAQSSKGLDLAKRELQFLKMLALIRSLISWLNNKI